MLSTELEEFGSDTDFWRETTNSLLESVAFDVHGATQHLGQIEQFGNHESSGGK